jgi:hypothetical protein
VAVARRGWRRGKSSGRQVCVRWRRAKATTARTGTRTAALPAHVTISKMSVSHGSRCAITNLVTGASIEMEWVVTPTNLDRLDPASHP